MKELGVATTVFLSLLVAVGLVVGVKSVPDIKRYMRMRQM
ncbi:DUF6893 family small protein [Hoyosella subflava]|uniref:Uncharacterized protein n=2 Tax=Hoyosella TaxID=697025 RepID=F6ENF6_HOYSD|nr:hypothetical protein AS9A_1978 [Hoyosella subflava DQS3-9A1]MBB3037317.1 hypothetical protein [Hoyosella altamirensis]